MQDREAVLEGLNMIEIGRMCVKTAGRDSNRKCVVIDILDEKYVLVDGQTRRKKVNVAHLEPLAEVLKIKKNESHESIAKLFGEKGIEMKAKGKKERKPKSDRQVTAKAAKAKANSEAKPKKEPKQAKPKKSAKKA